MGCLLKPIIGLIKMILMIIGLITVIVAIVLGVAIWQLTMTPALEGEMHEVIADYTDGYLFDEKLQGIEDAIKAGTWDGTLRLTDKEVTGKIELLIEETDIPLDVEDIWVNFHVDEETGANQVQILGKVNMGLSLTAGIVIEMSIEGGEPKITLDELAVGSGWLLPGAAKDQIANLIPTEEALKDALKALPVEWGSITIEGSDLVFTGAPKGATGPVI